VSVKSGKAERKAVLPSEHVVGPEIVAVKRKETSIHHRLHKLHKLSEAGFTELQNEQDWETF